MSRFATRESGLRVAILLAILLVVAAIRVGGVELGTARVTLQSHKYYSWWNMTRLVYRVKDSKTPKDSSWVLGFGDCVDEEAIEWWATSEYTWIDEPLRGMRFDRSMRNEKFYIWLYGQWDVGETDTAILFEDGEILVGQIDGPACESASISLETVGGSSVSFPELSGPGTYQGSEETVLRIGSTSAGWAISHALALSIPANASESIVANALTLSYDPFEAAAGGVDVRVSYAMHVSEADFSGLPQGAYVIEITYTVSTD